MHFLAYCPCSGINRISAFKLYVPFRSVSIVAELYDSLDGVVTVSLAFLSEYFVGFGEDLGSELVFWFDAGHAHDRMIHLRLLLTTLEYEGLLRRGLSRSWLCQLTLCRTSFRHQHCKQSYGRRSDQPSSTSLARRVCVQSPTSSSLLARVHLHGRLEV